MADCDATIAAASTHGETNQTYYRSNMSSLLTPELHVKNTILLRISLTWVMKYSNDNRCIAISALRNDIWDYVHVDPGMCCTPYTQQDGLELSGK